MLILAVYTSGCTESLQQYVKLSGWSHSPDKPVVISGSRPKDTSAFMGGFKDLTEADWKVLEDIAPRPIWERIAEQQGQLAKQKDHDNIIEKLPPAVDGTSAPPVDIPVTRLPDGRIQFLYILRNYGGPTVVTTRNPETKERKVTTKASDLKPIVDILKKNLAGQADISPLPSKNALAVTCAPETKDSVIAVISGIDIAPGQVEISARIFEVSHDFDFQLGAKTLINHIASDNTQALASTFSAKDFVGAVVDPLVGNLADPGGALRLMQVMENCGISLDITFQALARTGMVKVVAAPRMTVDAGQTAFMQAGQEMPIETAEIRNDNNLITRKLVYKPIGVQLYITPQAAGTESVKLHVVTSLSAISGFSPLPTLESAHTPHQTLVNPMIDNREAETYVTVQDGNTLVIGGMKMIRTVSRESKIPGLGDIEWLGWLFKNHRSQKQVNDLYFFVTPRLIR